jgi:hypothetical protein
MESIIGYIFIIFAILFFIILIKILIKKRRIQISRDENDFWIPTKIAKKAKESAFQEEEDYLPIDSQTLDPEYKKIFDYLQGKFSKKISQLLIWGLKDVFHTHRYIHKAFYRTARKLALPVIWCDDSELCQKYMKEHSLVIALGSYVKHLPFLENVFYCIHNPKKELPVIVTKDKFLSLKVFRGHSPDYKNFVSWDFETFFNNDDRTLVQSWGTDLFPWEFYKPVFPLESKQFNWVGSIWNPNKHILEELKIHLKKRGIEFCHFQRTTQEENIELIRKSRLAPAIGNTDQIKSGYIPCRFYKNISYGQFAFTNIPALQNTFSDCLVPGDTIAELVDNTLKLKEKEYLALIIKQQQAIKRQTYLHKLFHIVKAFCI